MTDKVQKIREEVERLMYGFNLEADIASCEDTETEKLANIKYQLCKKILKYIDSLQEEPASEDLEIAANEWDAKASFTPFYMALDDKGNPNGVEQDYTTHAESFKAGAKWQEEQFEKNRLKHCNSITNEQAELESVFIDHHLDKYQRMPTFLDAIQYGMNQQKEQFEKDCANLCKGIATAKGLAVTMAYNKGMDDAKEQMMAKAIGAHVNYAWSGLSFGGFDWSKTGLDIGDKCKLIIIKED